MAQTSLQVQNADHGHLRRRAPHPDDPGDDIGAVVIEYQRGNDLALKVLMTRFERSMRNVARCYVCGNHDIEDAVQEAWVAFACSACSIQTPVAVGAWLRVTTARAASKIARRQARCRPTDSLDDAVPTTPVDFESPERESEARVVRDAVARLDRNDRELLWLLFDADLSYSEIEARTGRAIGGIGPTRQRALSRLQKDAAVRRLVASHAV